MATFLCCPGFKGCVTVKCEFNLNAIQSQPLITFNMLLQVSGNISMYLNLKRVLLRDIQDIVCQILRV